MPSFRAISGPLPPTQTPEHITAAIEGFLVANPNSLLLENGRTLFDLREARYAISTIHDRTTLHLWSGERNLVRRVLAATPRTHTLRLTTQRMGQPRSETLELTPDKNLRTPTTRDTARQRYLHLLDRVLERSFPEERAEAFRSSADLERSFGPAYARGLLSQGQQAWAVIGINASESQAAIDGILTLGILWLQHCRDHSAPTATRPGRLVQGLRLILPRGTASTTLSRLPWLNQRLATWQIFELDEQTEALIERDPSDHGNLTTRLLHAPNLATAHERFADAIPQVLALLPPGTPTFGLDRHAAAPASPPIPEPKVRQEVRATNAPPSASGPAEVPLYNLQPFPHFGEDWRPAATGPMVRRSVAPAHRNAHPDPLRQSCELRLRSNTELAFLLHGLEFARIRSSFAGQSFNRQLEITVGSGPSETVLTPATAPHLRELVHHLFHRRQAGSSISGIRPAKPLSTTQDQLFRTRPERWLESTLRADLPALDPCLEPAPVYTEVPAFTGAGGSLDRGMLDLLAVTRDHRLAVIELKAEEDLHLALQGLDYWIRVRHHHLSHPDPLSGVSDLQQHGYFPHTRLSPESPHLYLVAPALHIHPATETILRHLDRRVPWTLIALDERWRTRIRPVWQKRSADIVYPLAPTSATR